MADQMLILAEASAGFGNEIDDILRPCLGVGPVGWYSTDARGELFSRKENEVQLACIIGELSKRGRE